MQSDGETVLDRNASVSGQSITDATTLESILATSSKVKTHLPTIWLSFKMFMESQLLETGAYACAKLVTDQLNFPHSKS